MKSKGSWLCAILISLFFLATNIHIASKRLLWFDELSTLRIAKLPDLATLWQVQTSFRADSAPIVYHLLVRLFFQLTGHAEITVRLLSALAMTAAILVVFDCARRLTNGVCGLIAVCVLASSFLTHYGYEGRPYAPVVLFTAIALWLWLNTEDSKPAAVAFGVVIFLLIEMHFNAVLALVPFGAWELFRWRPWRWPSSKFVAGVAGMFGAVGLSVVQMRQSAGWSGTSWCAPTAHALMVIWPSMFPVGLIVLAVMGILLCLARTGLKPMGDAERLCWFFLTIPFVGYILAEAVTNAFYDRYLIAILPGVAVGFACLVSRCLNRPASMALLLFFAALTIGRQVVQARHPEAIGPPSAGNQQLHLREVLAAEDSLLGEGKRNIITDFELMDALRYYSKRPDVYVMYGPDDDPLFCKYFGSACWDLGAVSIHAAETAAVYPTDLLLTTMNRAGFQATVKTTNPMVVYFSKR
jgi:4-amino-4-deoxy-L-arabinose transferase-like glycosyltransferase